MKVKCIKILDEESGEQLESSSWLSVGRVYQVLSVHMEHGRQLKFQLIGNDDVTPALHNADQFEVVSDYIPSNWIISYVSDSYFELSPKLWNVNNFWEEYFNGESKATSLFESEREKMLKEEE